MLTTRKSTDPIQTAKSLFPSELAHGMMVVEEKSYHQEGYAITISGLIGQPHVSRGNRNYQVFFVNGRSVRNEVLTHAYERGYEGAVMVHKFPVGIVYITISPELLDVNVHPSKTSIKFQEPRWMEEALLDFVQQGLEKSTQIVSAGGLGIGPTATELKIYEERRHAKRLRNESTQEKAGTDAETNNQIVEEQISLEPKKSTDPQWAEAEINGDMNDKGHINDEVDGNDEDDGNADNVNKGSVYQQVTSRDELPGFVFEKMVMQPQQKIAGEHLSQQAFLESVLKQKHFKIVGQAFKTYIILESGASLYLVDQHAAHERVVYDQLLADVQQGAVEIQEVMDGQILELSLSEMEWFQVHEATFRQMGFIIEPFGHQAIRLTGVPYHLGMPAHHEFLKQLMDELMEQEWSGAALPLEKLIRKACRYAIKAHDSLSVSEIGALLEQMTSLRVPLTCPHGRPIVLQMRDYDLEKLFKRV